MIMKKHLKDTCKEKILPSLVLVRTSVAGFQKAVLCFKFLAATGTKG